MLLLAVLSPGLPASEVAGAVRGRGLERAGEKARAPSGETEQLQRAVQAAVRAGVGERDAEALVESCLEAGFATPALGRVLTLAAQVALEKLPVESFLDKIDEGLAKRISPDRILQAAERRALMLKRAQGILKGAVLEGISARDAEDLVADVARALEAGTSPDEVHRLLVAAAREGESLGAIRKRLFP